MFSPAFACSKNGQKKKKKSATSLSTHCSVSHQKTLVFIFLQFVSNAPPFIPLDLNSRVLLEYSLVLW